MHIFLTESSIIINPIARNKTSIQYFNKIQYTVKNFLRFFMFYD